MRGPSNSQIGSLAVTTSLGSLSLAYWLLRRFRGRRNQSRALRGTRSRSNAATLTVGDFVCVRGTVSAGARRLESPMKGVPCVAYRVSTVRVVDSRKNKTKATTTGLWGLLSGLSSYIPWMFSVVASTQVDTEKWDIVYQPIVTRDEIVEIYIEDGDESMANLEAVARAGTGKRPRVRVDITGAEFFRMDEVAVDFKAEQASGSDQSSRTQLGYRTTEEVLAIGSKIVVLGEVSHDRDGEGGDVVLQKAEPKHFFDLKTSAISRPFVVSTKTEQGLLEEIERSGRVYFWLAIPSITFGLALAFWGIKVIVAGACEESSSSGKEITSVTEHGGKEATMLVGTPRDWWNRWRA